MEPKQTGIADKPFEYLRTQKSLGISENLSSSMPNCMWILPPRVRLQNKALSKCKFLLPLAKASS